MRCASFMYTHKSNLHTATTSNSISPLIHSVWYNNTRVKTNKWQKINNGLLYVFETADTTHFNVSTHVIGMSLVYTICRQSLQPIPLKKPFLCFLATSFGTSVVGLKYTKNTRTNFNVKRSRYNRAYSSVYMHHSTPMQTSTWQESHAHLS